MSFKPKPTPPPPPTSNVVEARAKDQQEQTSIFYGSSNISNIISSITANGILKTNKYIVEIHRPKGMIKESDQRDLQIRCMSASIPGQDIATQSYKIYGPLRQMPYEPIYTNTASFTYMLSRDMSERAFFESWMNIIVNKKDYKIGFYDQYTADVNIYVLDGQDKVAYICHLKEAYPKVIGEISVSNERENEYMSQEITFAFRTYESEYFDKQESTNNPQPKNNGSGFGSFIKGIGERANRIGKGLFG